MAPDLRLFIQFTWVDQPAVQFNFYHLQGCMKDFKKVQNFSLLVGFQGQNPTRICFPSLTCVLEGMTITFSWLWNFETKHLTWKWILQLFGGSYLSYIEKSNQIQWRWILQGVNRWRDVDHDACQFINVCDNVSSLLIQGRLITTELSPHIWTSSLINSLQHGRCSIRNSDTSFED